MHLTRLPAVAYCGQLPAAAAAAAAGVGRPASPPLSSDAVAPSDTPWIPFGCLRYPGRSAERHYQRSKTFVPLCARRCTAWRGCPLSCRPSTSSRWPTTFSLSSSRRRRCGRAGGRAPVRAGGLAGCRQALGEQAAGTRATALAYSGTGRARLVQLAAGCARRFKAHPTPPQLPAGSPQDAAAAAGGGLLVHGEGHEPQAGQVRRAPCSACTNSSSSRCSPCPSSACTPLPRSSSPCAPWPVSLLLLTSLRLNCAGMECRCHPSGHACQACRIVVGSAREHILFSHGWHTSDRLTRGTTFRNDTFLTRPARRLPACWRRRAARGAWMRGCWQRKQRRTLRRPRQRSMHSTRSRTAARPTCTNSTQTSLLLHSTPWQGSLTTFLPSWGWQGTLGRLA